MSSNKISIEELFLFKDELVEEIAKLYARDTRIAHHGESLFRSYASELVGNCHREAVEKLVKINSSRGI